ncbi:hypothetical protein P7C70_g4036, partial [Phenoliferia sp. Uapishka_3]
MRRSKSTTVSTYPVFLLPTSPSSPSSSPSPSPTSPRFSFSSKSPPTAPSGVRRPSPPHRTLSIAFEQSVATSTYTTAESSSYLTEIRQHPFLNTDVNVDAEIDDSSLALQSESELGEEYLKRYSVQKSKRLSTLEVEKRMKAWDEQRLVEEREKEREKMLGSERMVSGVFDDDGSKRKESGCCCIA